MPYALPAPNSYRRRPWLIKPEDTNARSRYADLNPRLPATVPFARQITIGCGAFLELLSIAAAQDRYAAKITPCPEGADLNSLEARPFSLVRFAAGAARPDPLFAHVRMPRATRKTYTTHDPPMEALASLRQAGR